jgi:NAD(P)-dependent dehydrogenase (short-subunit alcohol dehydrogenase family)
LRPPRRPRTSSRPEGGLALPFRADITKNDDVEAMVKACDADFGRVDVLDNNVGIAEVGGVVELSEESWDKVLAVNLKGAFLTMKHVIPLMMVQGGGSIINISSVAAIRYTGVPYATYYASKAALSHLTRTTAVEYAAKKVRVNAILPGLMQTPMVEHSAGLGQGPMRAATSRRCGEARRAGARWHRRSAWDVAWAAVFLASDESRYVTGIELVVDGGLTLKVGLAKALIPGRAGLLEGCACRRWPAARSPEPSFEDARRRFASPGSSG